MDANGYKIKDELLRVNLALGVNFLINLLVATVMAVKAVKLRTSQYKECFSPFGIFMFTLIFGPLGMIFSLWRLFRVKSGNATLKELSIK